MVYQKYLFLIAFIIFNLSIFLNAIKKSKKEFYSETPLLFLLGIYVWGDGLILAPFWMISGLIFLFLPMALAIKYLLIFYIARSFYEVFYWLNHQASKSDHNPPLFRKMKWLKANESAILYQLIHMCIVIFGVFIFLLV